MGYVSVLRGFRDFAAVCSIHRRPYDNRRIDDVCTVKYIHPALTFPNQFYFNLFTLLTEYLFSFNVVIL